MHWIHSRPRPGHLSGSTLKFAERIAILHKSASPYGKDYIPVVRLSSRRGYFDHGGAGGEYGHKYIHSSFRLLGLLVRIPAIVVGTGASAAAYANYKFESSYKSFMDNFESVYKFFGSMDFGSDADDSEEDSKAASDEVDPISLSLSNSNSDADRTSMDIAVYPNEMEKSDGSTMHLNKSISASDIGSTRKEDDLIRLSKLIMEVSNLLKDANLSSQSASFKIPGVVVIGSQSSGKSSLLESMVGMEFLPKGLNMVTRRPLELNMVCTPDEKEGYYEFPQLGTGRMNSLKKVMRTLEDLNKAVPEEMCVSEEPIVLTVHSPSVPDLRLIDLPGYIQVVNMNQPEILKQKICDLCDKYIKGDNIILAVCAADVDLANSEALRASRVVDPLGNRTIGVITKLDLVDPQVGISILTNKNYPLKLGYVGVSFKPVSGSFKDDPVKNMEHRINLENEYFSKEPYKSSNCLLGLEKLKSYVRDVLQESFMRSLNSITNGIQLELEEARYDFKVLYNDRRITPEGYTAEVIEILKNKFRGVERTFQKPRVRREVMSLLEDQCIELLFSQYWKNPNIFNLSNANNKDLEYWKTCFDKVSNQITKSGIGKSSVQVIVSKIMENIDHISGEGMLVYHSGLKEKAMNLASKLLKANLHTTIDQVENSIKPYKFEIDCFNFDWKEARAHSLELLNNYISVVEKTLVEIQSITGRRKLRRLMTQLYQKMRDEDANAGIGDPLGTFPLSKERRPFKSILISKTPDAGNGDEQTDEKLAEQALILDCLLHVLKSRRWAVESNVCSTSKNNVLCPEVYLTMISEKLTHSAVMFIWIELLNDFFYQMPRSIDDNLYYVLGKKETEAFACQNPAIRKQLELMKKKGALEAALLKLREIRNSS